MTTNLQGDIPGYGTVWFHPVGIVNILSLSKVAEKYCISCNSTCDNKFLIYLPRVEVRSFMQCERGIFCSELAAGQGKVRLNTLDHNTSKYSERDCTRVLMARKLQYKIDLPSHRHPVKIVEGKVQMLNCPLN